MATFPKKQPRLNDVFTDSFTNGIFKYIHTISPTVPWGDEIDATTLDVEYFGNISGQKNVSPLVKMLLKKSETDTLTNEDISRLANIIYKMNITNWTKLHDTLEFEYNPISNYDMSETETSSGTEGYIKNNTGTQNITHTGTQADANTGTVTTTHTGTQADANTGTISTTHTGTQETENTGTITTDHTGTQRTVDEASATGTGSGTVERSIYGFNSSTAVGDSGDSTANSTSTSSEGDSTRTDNLTDEQTNDTVETRTDNLSDLQTNNTTSTRTDNLTDLQTNNTTSTRTDNLTDGRTDNLSEANSGTHSDTRTLTRSGNIGVTTSQQMIESERELWQWNFIYNVVFPSVDKILTICTY